MNFFPFFGSFTSSSSSFCAITISEGILVLPCIGSINNHHCSRVFFLSLVFVVAYLSEEHFFLLFLIFLTFSITFYIVDRYTVRDTVDLNFWQESEDFFRDFDIIGGWGSSRIMSMEFFYVKLLIIANIKNIIFLK